MNRWRQKFRQTLITLILGLHLLLILVVTFFALVLWQPVTAMCKFFRDGRYHTTEGTTKGMYLVIAHTLSL